MKRFIASIGLMLLAAQVALGSSGSLFLCLCNGHDEHASPCAPATEDEAPPASCLHDEPASPAVTEHADQACDDLLFTGDDLDPVNRLGDVLKIKASQTLNLASFTDYRVQLSPLSERQPQAARAPPQQTPRCTVYTRTTKLLI